LGCLCQTEFPVFHFVLELVLSGHIGGGSIASHSTEQPGGVFSIYLVKCHTQLQCCLWPWESKSTSPFSACLCRCSAEPPGISLLSLPLPGPVTLPGPVEGAAASAAWQGFALNTRTQVVPFSWHMGDERLNCSKRRNSPIFCVGAAITGLPCVQGTVVKGPWPSARSVVAAEAWGCVSSRCTYWIWFSGDWE